LQGSLATNNKISNIRTESNELVYGEENVVNEELLFFSNSRDRIDTHMDHSGPSLAIEIESIKKSFLDAKRRDVRLRYLT
jgi:hypothetical protein